MQTSKRFENIALPHLDSVYRAAIAVCGRSDLAEDLTQMTFVRALERFDTLKPGTNCKAWLLQIMRHLWIDRLRHKRASPNKVPINENLVEAPREAKKTAWSDAEDLLENFSDKHVIDALRRLSGDQRLTLFLIDVEQLNQRQVAKIMGVAVGTVKSRTNRARNELKSYLLSYAKEMGFAGRDRWTI
jgi:RNA polymerase sigma-70 factor (ECF subfamily)